MDTMQSEYEFKLNDLE